MDMDFMDFMKKLSQDNLKIEDIRKSNRKMIREHRENLIEFLQADRERIIIEGQQEGLLDSEYFDSPKYRKKIETALKLSQIIRLLMEESQF